MTARGTADLLKVWALSTGVCFRRHRKYGNLRHADVYPERYIVDSGLVEASYIVRSVLRARLAAARG